jgi:hypothetical protein
LIESKDSDWEAFTTETISTGKKKYSHKHKNHSFFSKISEDKFKRPVIPNISTPENPFKSLQKKIKSTLILEKLCPYWTINFIKFQTKSNLSMTVMEPDPALEATTMLKKSSINSDKPNLTLPPAEELIWHFH